MEILQIKELLAAIDATFPTFKVDNPTETVKAWYALLKDYDYEQIKAAFKVYINTSGSKYAPSVPELIAMVHKKNEREYLNESEAWDLVYKAICNSNYHAREEFEKLPPIIQKTIGSENVLREMAQDANFNNGVESSNFKKSYQIMVRRDKENKMLPPSLKMQLEDLYERIGIEVNNG